MKIVVAVKQVPDTMAVKVREDGTVERENVPAILNPYCEQALMTALSVKGDGEVVVVSMGPPQAESSLRRCIELGADKAYLISDRDIAGSDTWATSRALAAFIGKYEPDADLYMFGRMAIDGDTGQVPSEVAQLLNVQQFSYVDSIRMENGEILVTQDYDTFERECKVPKGSVISTSGVDPNGHIPTVGGYLRASKAEIIRINRVDLGLGLYSVGLKGSKTKIVHTYDQSGSRRNVKIEISTPAKAAELIIKETEGIR